jgi:hypothetical protein
VSEVLHTAKFDGRNWPFFGEIAITVLIIPTSGT